MSDNMTSEQCVSNSSVQVAGSVTTPVGVAKVETSPSLSPPTLPGLTTSPEAPTSPMSPATAGKKRKKAAKRLWLPWEFCKLIEPQNSASLPPFGWEKPSAVTDEEKGTIASESETLFPVGFYDMTPAKRGVTKGRGDWKGKEALRLAHCSAEKNGCRFKARFCRVIDGLQVYTSGTHDIKAHLTPRKRGLAPAARAIVTKYRDESQSKLVEWLKDGGLLDDAGNDLEKVKQQIKRRKMTLKRKQKRNFKSGLGGQDSDSASGTDENSQGVGAISSGGEEEEDPLFSAKIQMLQDDSIVSLIDPPENGRSDTLKLDAYHSDDDHFKFAGGAPFVGANPFGDGPYSPTTVIDEVPINYSFQNMFEHTPLLHTTDLFPRNSHDYPLHSAPQQQQNHQQCEKPFPLSPPPPRPPTPPPVVAHVQPQAGLDPDGSYYHAEV